MRKGRSLSVRWMVMLTLALAAAAGQEAPSPPLAQQQAETMRRLAAQLRVQTKEDDARYTQEFREQITDRARQLLKGHILETLTESNGNARIVADSLKPFGEPGWDRDGSVPFAIHATVYGDPVVITGFQFVRRPAGAPDIKPFVHAYRKRAGSREFVAEAEDDLDGYVLTLEQLKSPGANELWLLTYGVKTGAKILSLHMRVYAFDGERFTTPLSPPDRPYGQVQVEGDQIVVRSVAYDADKRRRTERYWLSVSGVSLLTSTLDGE
ncbi:MAG: hypothetical protein K6T61_16760 [Bryobacteraceae bacterium]|nr:hypothetical protein [Bryobacteraceae bacterium]